MILTKLIQRAYKYNGLVTAYIYGEFGYGKTSYALWTAKEVYGNWETALKYLFFKPQDVIKTLGEAIGKNRRIPLIIMDDAGLWLDRLTWYEPQKVKFMEIFNLLRSVVSGILFTTPSEELPKQILNKSFFRIKIDVVNPNKENLLPEILNECKKKIDEYELEFLISKATGYALKTLPSFFRLVQKRFIDYFPTWYPNPVYQKYNEKRREALKHYYKKLIETVEEESETKRSTRTREDWYIYILNKLEDGTPRHNIVKELNETYGIPLTTAYRWIKEVKRKIEKAKYTLENIR